MPVFNAARYLAPAIESMLAQTFADFEFIIVDDGSTDRSPEILARFAKKDARIAIISRPNTGIVGALNDGLARAKGEFIARMDADDLSRPDRLAVQLAFLETHPGVVALGSSVTMVDPAGRLLKNFKAFTDSETVRREITAMRDIGVIHPTLMVRRSVLNRLGGYRQQYNLVEDVDLFFRLLDEGELANVPELLVTYRQHETSTNSKKHEIQRPLMLQCMAEHRQRWGLPPIDSPLPPPPPAIPGAQHIQWAFWAVEGGQRLTALRHALIACRQSRLAPQARKCLNYVLHTLINPQPPSLP